MLSRLSSCCLMTGEMGGEGLCVSFKIFFSVRRSAGVIGDRAVSTGGDDGIVAVSLLCVLSAASSVVGCKDVVGIAGELGKVASSGFVGFAAMVDMCEAEVVVDQGSGILMERERERERNAEGARDLYKQQTRDEETK
jgi:hypothetical protein